MSAASSVGASIGMPEGAAVRQAPRRALEPAVVLPLCWLGALVICAVFAGVLPIPNPTHTDVAHVSAAPSSAHLLGTDALGRDILSRIIYGSRVSLTVGFGSVAFAALVGGGLGLLAGYVRGWLDGLVLASIDILLSFPALVFIIAVTTFLGANLRNVTIALGVVTVAPMARIARANTLKVSGREYVLAAIAMGARRRTILLREIAPNVVVSLLAFATVAVAVAVTTEGALAFLGLSVQPPTPTWGGMIADGLTDLQSSPHEALFPAGALMLTILALNVLGEAFQRRLDVRESRL